MNTTKKYVMTFAQDGNGEETKYRFILSLSKRIEKLGQPILDALMSTEGIDSVQPIGRYTIDICIARSFNADEVIATLEPKLDALLSDIITAKLIT